MAMKDLGTQSEIYDHPTSMPEQPKKSYPKLRLPISFAGADWTLGDKIVLEFEAEVVGVQQDEYTKEVTFELQKGELETVEEEAKQHETEKK